MTTTPVRVVYDCVVFLQGAGRRSNAARECLNLVDAGIIQLYLSSAVLKEIEDVLNRPELLQKFPLIKSEDSQVLLRTVRSKSLLLTDVSNVFTLPRDPDDEPYTDLAIAANAAYLVTWNDRHLTYLMRQDTPEGVEFRQQPEDYRSTDVPARNQGNCPNRGSAIERCSPTARTFCRRQSLHLSSRSSGIVAHETTPRARCGPGIRRIALFR